MDVLTKVWTNRRTDRWPRGQMDQQMDQHMDGDTPPFPKKREKKLKIYSHKFSLAWMDGRIDEWIDA